MKSLFHCAGCLFLGLLLLGAAPTRQPTTYQPPIGIPAPSFGIEEVAPAPPAAWPGAASPGYYYIDNSHPNATDTDNSYGYPNRPRQSIPEISYPAGSYVEVHGGDYADANLRVDFNIERWQVDVAGTTPTPDAIPPTITLTSPVDLAAVAGSIHLVANVTDNAGVASVQFLVDGAEWGAPVTASPYTLALDTTTLAPGLHTISATARDTAGNAATATALRIMVNPQLFLPIIVR